MTHTWLHLRLAAPLVAFGDVAIDHVGPTCDFPTASGLTGLLANALGLERSDFAALQALADRLVFGALILRDGRLLTDSQNARLQANDRGFTTWGRPDDRAGASYDSPHRRRRDYLADAELRVVLRLLPADPPAPDLERIAAALDYPARPLFIGRKPCLPAGRLLVGPIEAGSVRDALVATGCVGRALWPADDAPSAGATTRDIADLRNWHSGLHGGSRRVVEGRIG